MRTFKTWVIGFSFCVLACDFSSAAAAQSEQSPAPVETSVSDASTGNPDGPELSPNDSNERRAGRVSGRILDPVGVPVAGARVRLAGQSGAAIQEVLSGEDGQFTFANVAPGIFHLTISSSGFGTRNSAAT